MLLGLLKNRERILNDLKTKWGGWGDTGRFGDDGMTIIRELHWENVLYTGLEVCILDTQAAKVKLEMI